MVDGDPTADLTDDELANMQDALNEFEPKDLHTALMALPSLAGKAVATGPLDFGSVLPGVLVYRGENGAFRIRVTVAEMTGGTYDELEMSGAELRQTVASARAALVRQNAPRTRR